jgi:hypothetical protein
MKGRKNVAQKYYNLAPGKPSAKKRKIAQYGHPVRNHIFNTWGTEMLGTYLFIFNVYNSNENQTTTIRSFTLKISSLFSVDSW